MINMKKLILVISSLLLLCCSNKVMSQSEYSVFDSMRSGYQLMEFISSSEAIIVNAAEWQAFESALISQGLNKNSVEDIAIGNSLVKSMPNSNVYTSSSNKESVLVEVYEDEAVLATRWREVQEAVGVYSGIQNSNKGTYYLKLDESEYVNLNATFRNDKCIFNIKQELSFINTDTDSWNASQINEYFASIKKLNDIIEVFLEYFVRASEKVYRPLNGRQLTSEERLFGFVNFWTEVKYNFAFFDQVPKLDWDAVLLEYLPRFQSDQSNTDYYKLLSEVCALLNDGHTDIYLPSEFYQNIGRAALDLRVFDNDIYLTNFDKALDSKLDIGLKLVKINGVPVDRYIERNIYPYISASTEYIKRRKAISSFLEGEIGSSIDLEFINQSDVVVSLKLEWNRRDFDWFRDRPEIRLTNFSKQGNIGMLELNTFGSQAVVQDFKSYLDSLVLLDKLVIDLRKNGGGDSGYAYQILDYFSSQAIVTSK